MRLKIVFVNGGFIEIKGKGTITVDYEFTVDDVAFIDSEDFDIVKTNYARSKNGAEKLDKKVG